MSTSSPAIQSLTPILLVDAIEPCLPFWQNLGFTVTVTVPASNNDKLVFAILVLDKLELMFQTFASATENFPSVRPGTATGILYLHVPSLDALIAKLGNAEIVGPRHTTFYGADEIYVRTPGGHIAGFAESSRPPESP